MYIVSIIDSLFHVCFVTPLGYNRGHCVMRVWFSLIILYYIISLLLTRSNCCVVNFYLTMDAFVSYCISELCSSEMCTKFINDDKIKSFNIMWPVIKLRIYIWLTETFDIIQLGRSLLEILDRHLSCVIIYLRIIL